MNVRQLYNALCKRAEELRLAYQDDPRNSGREMPANHTARLLKEAAEAIESEYATSDWKTQ